MSLLLADIIWPALVVEERLVSPWVIGLGLLVEFYFIRRLTTLSFWRCVLADVVVNAVSAILGLALLPFVGTTWDFLADFALDSVFNFQSISSGGWLLLFFCSVLINALVETALLRFVFKQHEWFRIFWWMCLANAITVGIAFISLMIWPPIPKGGPPIPLPQPPMG
jgi:hypothetical protein